MIIGFLVLYHHAHSISDDHNILISMHTAFVPDNAKVYSKFLEAGTYLKLIPVFPSFTYK
jgi:hypothetical protein